MWPLLRVRICSSSDGAPGGATTNSSSRERSQVHWYEALKLPTELPGPSILSWVLTRGLFWRLLVKLLRS